MQAAISECDLVLMSGGSSAGNKDETLRVISSFENSNIFIHGVAIRPGKPTIVGKVGDKFMLDFRGIHWRVR